MGDFKSLAKMGREIWLVQTKCRFFLWPNLLKKTFPTRATLISIILDINLRFIETS